MTTLELGQSTEHSLSCRSTFPGGAVTEQLGLQDP